MVDIKKEEYIKNLEKDLKIDCKDCFGYCCVALYFSKCDGFPENKDAGDACKNLSNDFSCKVHSSLRDKGLKGCTIYDCFGAGQKVAQKTYKNENWIKNKNLAGEMFGAFLVVRNLHEMIWYLKCSLDNSFTKSIHSQIMDMIDDTIKLTNLEPDKLLKLDIDNRRKNVNKLLMKSSELLDSEVKKKNIIDVKGKKKIDRGFDFIGKDLRKFNLVGADFKGGLLIAANLSNTDLSYANFIGADLRDANLCGADLSKSIFITQIQINSAKGDISTKLPKYVDRPIDWF